MENVNEDQPLHYPHSIHVSPHAPRSALTPYTHCWLLHSACVDVWQREWRWRPCMCVWVRLCLGVCVCVCVCVAHFSECVHFGMCVYVW